jgi:Rrf2 family protein
MLSQTTEYALRVVAHLASLDEPATTRQIAQATLVPEGYLAKVLQGLSRAGLVSSQRGLHGGSVLARPPAEITLYDVVQAIDPIKRIKTCPLGLKSHGTRLCGVHRRLDNAMDAAEQVFKGSTLADMLAEPTSSKPLCDAVDGELDTDKTGRRVKLTVKKK